MPFKLAIRLTFPFFNTSRNVTLSVRPSVCHTFFSFFPDRLSKLKKISHWGVINEKISVFIVIFFFLLSIILYPTQSHFTVIQRLTKTRKKLQACKHCLRTFWVKIADIFDQKIASPCLGVSHWNFTILDDKKGPTVI